MAVTNDGSNLKTNLIGSGYGITPASIPSTNGTAGYHVYPTGWTWGCDDSIPFSSNSSLEDKKKRAPIGISTLDYVWGNPSLPWIKKLGPTSSPGNILTVIAQKEFEKGYCKSLASTTIKHLIPGKKYSITFQVATTIRNTPQGPTQYSPTVSLDLSGVKNGNSGLNGELQFTAVDLTGKQAEWVTQTITFQADKTEAKVLFSIALYGDYVKRHTKFYHYAHISIGDDAVKEVN